VNKHYWSLGHRLPALLAVPLFGDRRRFGLEIQEQDPDWLEWQTFYQIFYQETQKQGLGKVVNDAGYQILRQVDLNRKNVLEVGPGSLPHRRFWNGVPNHYKILDIKQTFIDQSLQVLTQASIPTTAHLSSSPVLPLKDESVDLIISFYSLEHLYALDEYLREFKRILRPGGQLVGGIPCEGGLAWGTGRFLTSRPYIRENSGINPDKIICWEHPNFAEHILQVLERHFEATQVQFWPLKLPLIDFNLVVRFIYEKRNRSSVL
jgi:SAM-dependent methyltransferase